ncbi:MAG: NAD(P)-binding protein [Actinophytocola sp.]|uniref:FAD-dependent oxidoreductase n=1 Tax=Actinophytocola sp. TaxID=1872138 RepID=UPI001322D1FC|nr:FAD-dependent monooxygenase [Actinophytocola sp.]MPZ85317.1 NAD(P)-binding protein [Actinophytocola sp.]
MTEHNSKSEGASPHVLIIGGGVGGLCLAQGLTKSGISVALYERGESASFRGQGARISLKKAGSDALRACLPGNLFDLCVATSIAPATRMAVTDQWLNEAFAMPIPHVEPEDSTFGVNRLTIREILLSGLDDVVHFTKSLVRYEHPADGRVRAHFADGTAATGDLLVGADGTNSVTRNQLVPDAELEDLHWSIWGKTPITGGLEWVPEVLVDSFNRIKGPGGTSMSVATCRPRTPVADAVAALAPGTRLTEVPDYFSWTVSLTDEFRDGDSATLHRLVRDLTADWHPAVRRIVAEAEVPATFPVNIRSARPVLAWSDPAVTLLGDAIHTMSPGRGEGANTALRDAELLRGALVDVTTKGVPLGQAKAAYEAEMLRHGFAAVASSRTNPLMRMGSTG